jgi:uncharacterized membrane protein
MGLGEPAPAGGATAAVDVAPPPAERAAPWTEPQSRAVRFWLPIAFMVVGILVASHFVESWASLGGLLAVYHFPLGAYTSVPIALGLGFSPLFVMLFMGYMRVFGALFFVWNLYWLRALPWLGKYVARAEAKGHAVWESRPWVRRLGLVGLALFVFLPVAGTGLVTGSVIGRLSGLDWFPTWMALSVGALLQLLLLTLVVSLGWSFLPLPAA